MTEYVVYRAYDGSSFDSKDVCARYEDKQYNVLLHRISLMKRSILPEKHASYLESKSLVAYRLNQYGLYGDPRAFGEALLAFHAIKEHYEALRMQYNALRLELRCINDSRRSQR